jgi:hypothetical protein
VTGGQDQTATLRGDTISRSREKSEIVTVALLPAFGALIQAPLSNPRSDRMLQYTGKILGSLLLIFAATGIASAQKNPLVGNWHGVYTFPAAAPNGLAGAKIDDSLVLNSDGSFRETERGPHYMTSVVWGHYTVKDDMMHLTPEKWQPKSASPTDKLPPEDMQYKFAASDRWAGTYTDNSTGKPLLIHETFERAR